MKVLNPFHRARPFVRAFLFLFFLFPLKVWGGGGEGKDSVPRFDLGSLFDRTPLDLAMLERKRDSLEGRAFIARKDLERLNSYLSAEPKDETAIVREIDSLLDGGEVDKDRMRAVHVMIAKHKEDRHTPFLLPYDDGAYPARSVYGVWNTRMVSTPYRGLWRKDEKGKERRVRLVAPEWECGFAMPVEGQQTSDYGIRDGRMHHGIDIDLRIGDPVRAAFPGVVRVSRYFKGYGRAVVIRHYNGLETLYAHLHRAKVRPGDRVEAGQRIGSGGNTGRSTGSHLHFEARFKGVSVNPAHFIAFDEKRLMGDTLVLKKGREGYAAYPTGTRFHTVEHGDFLYRIAQRYGVPIRKLCELNGIHRNSTLWVGQRIRLGI